MQDENDKALEALLKDYPAPKADPAFFDRALAEAARRGRQRERRSGWMAGFGTAAAAALVLWVGVTWMTPAPETSGPEIPGIVMTLESPKTVNLMFASASALGDAQVTLQLPEGVELEGFPGERNIQWMTSLDAGKNLLPLPLIARHGDGGELVATLEHGERSKTFRIQIDLRTSRG